MLLDDTAIVDPFDKSRNLDLEINLPCKENSEHTTEIKVNDDQAANLICQREPEPESSDPEGSNSEPEL